MATSPSVAMSPEKKEPMWVHCAKCSHEWAPCFLPVTVDLFAKVGKSRCPACNSKAVMMGQTPKPTNEGDPVAWLSNGDTGVSSMTIWHVLMRHSMGINQWPDVPHDPSDFGRCYRLLKVMPSWRARLPEVAEKYPKWKPLIEAWDELTALYEKELPTGMAPELYDRMQKLRR